MAKSTPDSFEQNLQALEKIVEKLESGSVTLDEAIALFQKGRELSHQCEARLKEAELKIRQLMENEEGKLETAEFDIHTEANHSGEESEKE